MGSKGVALAAIVLILGGVVDYFITSPFFVSLASGTSFAGWNPLTVFLYLYCVPYAFSVAGVSAAIGGIRRR
jgi:hypothetical protein